MFALPLLATLLQIALPQGPHTIITSLTPAELPSALTAKVLAASPGLTITGAERKEREDRIYFDVAGQRPDGAEIELDVQQINDGFDIVEIQRDLTFDEMPEPVRALTATALGQVRPARIIESVQKDGIAIFELFAPGQPAEPSAEIRFAGGEAKLLTERWPH
ncbi:hypothetical protein D3C85_411460 [compost metagenome]|jgi:hypothetical protein